MKCRTCGQEMHERDGEDLDHHLHRMFDGRCLGCFVFAVELEKFLIRANGRTHIGDWEDGWMKAIIEDAARYIR